MAEKKSIEISNWDKYIQELSYGSNMHHNIEFTLALESFQVPSAQEKKIA